MNTSPLATRVVANNHRGENDLPSKSLLPYAPQGKGARVCFLVVCCALDYLATLSARK